MQAETHKMFFDVAVVGSLPLPIPVMYVQSYLFEHCLRKISAIDRGDNQMLAI